MGVPSSVSTQLPCLGDFSAAFVKKNTLRYFGSLQSGLIFRAELFLRQGLTLAKVGVVLCSSQAELNFQISTSGSVIGRTGILLSRSIPGPVQLLCLEGGV